jgi:hypothetical protein
MSINYSKVNAKYLENPRLWIRDLQRHRAFLKETILGEDGEWRQELEFILRRTDETIDAVHAKLVEDGIARRPKSDLETSI